MSWNTNIVELANMEPPPFHNRELSIFSWWKNGLFLTGETQLVKDISIDLSKIVGHAQGYPPMTWNYMLNNLKRISKNLNLLEKSPDYYLERLGSGVSFLEIDGQLFIGTGKHRATIAKYLAHFNPHKFDDQTVHGVDVLRYEVNHSLINQVEKLRATLKEYDFSHLELKWIESSNRFTKNRFMLSNKFRQGELPLFVEETELHQFGEMLTSSKSLWGSFRSEKINYLRRPFLTKLFFSVMVDIFQK
jgi:hypothetical protein